jgi:hypothetical protein
VQIPGICFSFLHDKKSQNHQAGDGKDKCSNQRINLYQVPHDLSPFGAHQPGTGVRKQSDAAREQHGGIHNQ